MKESKIYVVKEIESGSDVAAVTSVSQIMPRLEKRGVSVHQQTVYSHIRNRGAFTGGGLEVRRLPLYHYQK